MNKTTKKLLILFTFMTSFFILLFFLVGEYFFNYALVRKQDKPEGSNRNISSIVTEKNKNMIEHNQYSEREKTSKWLSSVNNSKISITSKDNLNLIGSQICQGNLIHKYVIVIHGYSKQKEDFYDIAYNYYNKGFNVIIPDLRAHGESEGKYIGMGWLDKDDIKLWIDKIVSYDSNAEIILHGVSMGAATAMMTVGDIVSTDHVKAVIEDCGYTSVHDIFTSELKARYGLPSFPIMNSMALVTRIHSKYNIFEASSLKQVSKTNVPILVIHGNADNFVPVHMAYEIYNHINSKKDILIISGAGHNECRFLDPKLYYDKVYNFINNNI